MSFSDFVILFSFILEVGVLQYVEYKAWKTLFTPLSFLMLPYLVVLIITLFISGTSFGFVAFYYPSILIWHIGIFLFAIPSFSIAYIMQRKGLQMTIDTSQEGMVGIVDNKFGVNTANTGSLTYNDLKFTFDRQTYGGDSIAKNLAFFKDGLSIIKITTKNSNNLTLDNLLSKNVAFKGNMEITALEGLMNLRSDISNLNKFYATGLALVGLGLTGTTKDICQKQADAFNSIVSSQFLFGGDMKEMFVEPMLADSVRNIYVPSLILQADPANGGEKVTLMEALEAIGVAFENLMQLFAE